MRRLIQASLRFLAVLATATTATTACQPEAPGPVIYVGDSITWQARSVLAANTAGPSELIAMGGTAACDLAPVVLERLRSTTKPKPRLIVVEFYGNNLTPCMGAAKDTTGGYAVGSSKFMSAYKASLSSIAQAAKDAGVEVRWADAPPRYPTNPAADLNGRLAALAAALGWKRIPASSAISTTDGTWIARMTCRARDASHCEPDGRVTVRSSDHVHFDEPRPDGFSAGATRWGLAVATGAAA